MNITAEEVRQIREDFGVSLPQAKRIAEKRRKTVQLSKIVQEANNVAGLKEAMLVMIADLYHV